MTIHKGGTECTRQLMCPQFCKRERLMVLQPILAQFCIKVVPLFNRTAVFGGTSSIASGAATVAGCSFCPSLFRIARITRTGGRQTLRQSEGVVRSTLTREASSTQIVRGSPVAKAALR